MKYALANRTSPHEGLQRTACDTGSAWRDCTDFGDAQNLDLDMETFTTYLSRKSKGEIFPGETVSFGPTILFLLIDTINLSLLNV